MNQSLSLHEKTPVIAAPQQRKSFGFPNEEREREQRERGSLILEEVYFGATRDSQETEQLRKTHFTSKDDGGRRNNAELWTVENGKSTHGILSFFMLTIFCRVGN